MIPNQQQSEAWNGAESMHYVDHADRYDRQLAPVTEALVARAGIEPGHRVLDVGSGSGATTLEAAKVAEEEAAWRSAWRSCSAWASCGGC